MAIEQLKLENQLCFPIYAASRLITREYQPFLDELGVTYPQYLVLMILWETDGISVNEITRKLILNTNTVTPLLKRMEIQEIITRQRSSSDERKVIIKLTGKGIEIQKKAAEIPLKLVDTLLAGSLTIDDLVMLKDKLYQMIDLFSTQTTGKK